MTEVTKNANEFIIHLKSSFSAIRVIDNDLIPSTWEISTDVATEIEDAKNLDFEVAVNKIKFWFENIIENSILFSISNKWAIESFINKTTNIPVLCPFEPQDDHLVLLFHAKMNALAGPNTQMGYTSLSSSSTGGMSFTYVGEHDPYLPAMKDWMGTPNYFSVPWWHRDDGSSIDVSPKKNADLTKTPEFAFDLNFIRDQIVEMESEKPEENNVVPFTKKKEFKPKVIDGDKED